MTKIEDRHIARAKKLVLQKFPEMVGAELAVSEKRSQSKAPGRGSAPTGPTGRHYVLIFERDVSLPGGHNMKRLVRVTMDESGEVLKVTSSK